MDAEKLRGFVKVAGKNRLRKMFQNMDARYEEAAKKQEKYNDEDTPIEEKFEILKWMHENAAEELYALESEVKELREKTMELMKEVSLLHKLLAIKNEQVERLS